MADYSAESPYLECQAILAAQAGDVNAVNKIIDKLSPAEQGALYTGCQMLIIYLEEAGRQRT